MSVVCPRDVCCGRGADFLIGCKSMLYLGTGKREEKIYQGVLYDREGKNKILSRRVRKQPASRGIKITR